MKTPVIVDAVLVAIVMTPPGTTPVKGPAESGRAWMPANVSRQVVVPSVVPPIVKPIAPLEIAGAEMVSAHPAPPAVVKAAVGAVPPNSQPVGGTSENVPVPIVVAAVSVITGALPIVTKVPPAFAGARPVPPPRPVIVTEDSAAAGVASESDMTSATAIVAAAKRRPRTTGCLPMLSPCSAARRMGVPAEPGAKLPAQQAPVTDHSYAACVSAGTVVTASAARSPSLEASRRP